MKHQTNNLIIGPGITGLTFAFGLEKNNLDYLLVGNQPFGGMVSSIHKDGFILEAGPNVFLAKSAMQELILDLGISHEVAQPKISNYQQFVWDDSEKKLVEVPKGLKKFIKTDSLKLTDKIKIVKSFFSSLPFKNDDLSVYDFFLRFGSVKFVSLFLDAVLKGIYGGNLKDLSARIIFPKLFESAKEGKSFVSYLFNKPKGQSKILVFKKGNHFLAESIATKIPTNKKIEDIIVSLDYISENLFLATLASGEQIEAKNVYVATSGKATNNYLSNQFVELKNAIQQIKFAPLVVLHFSAAYNVNIPEEAFGVLVSGGNDGFLGVMFNSQLFPHTAPLNKKLFTVVIGGSDRPEVFSHSAEELEMLARKKIQEILNVSDLSLLNISMWPTAIPQFQVGYQTTIDLFNDAEKKFVGLRFIGTDQGGVGVADRVNTAYSLANLVKGS